jgi:hypothetical protein
MAQQTAVHELFLKWLHRDLTTEDFEQAKEMFQQQIVDAVTYGNRQEFYDATETIGKQYYTQTYGK